VGRWAGAVESLHLTISGTLRGVKKILVVEDDPINQMILSDFLAANGYETLAAASGPEGIERFDRDVGEMFKLLEDSGQLSNTPG